MHVHKHKQKHMLKHTHLHMHMHVHKLMAVSQDSLASSQTPPSRSPNGWTPTLITLARILPSPRPQAKLKRPPPSMPRTRPY